MEDKIETGEYIRTVDGKFGMFDRYSSRKKESYYKSPFDCFIKLQNRKTPLQCCSHYIKNHRKNIIDLIDIGDYVNGEVVIKIYDKNQKYKFSDYVFEEKTIETYNDNYETIPFENLYINSDIKSIVTKEQFESMKYEVK